MTSITAIVPTFNRSAYLREALASILAQTAPVAEIVVWDDGSTDGTREAAAEMAGAARGGPPLRYFRAPNAGKSRALNRAMAEAGGEAIWICDDDDICRPDAAARMLDAMATTGAPVVGGRYLRFGVDPETGRAVTADPGYWPDLSRGSMLRHLLEDIFIFQNATLAARAAYDRVGPFREDLPRSIDYDMIVRLAARHPVGYVDAVLFEQRKHDGARGPAAARHAAALMDDVWLGADQLVFRDLHEALPLSLYAAMFDAAEPRGAARAARLQRAAVYARRDLWDLAFDDFEAAAGMDPRRGLCAVEQAICGRAAGGKHGCAGLLTPETGLRIDALRRSGAAGAAMSAALGAGLRWRVRAALAARRPGAAADLTRLLLRLAGPRAFVRFAPRSPPDPLRERTTLPEEAYRW